MCFWPRNGGKELYCEIRKIMENHGKSRKRFDPPKHGNGGDPCLLMTHITPSTEKIQESLGISGHFEIYKMTGGTCPESQNSPPLNIHLTTTCHISHLLQGLRTPPLSGQTSSLFSQVSGIRPICDPFGRCSIPPFLNRFSYWKQLQMFSKSNS